MNYQKCPVCEGRQTVPAGFYEDATAGTDTAREECRSCKGLGYLGFPDYVAPPAPAPPSPYTPNPYITPQPGTATAPFYGPYWEAKSREVMQCAPSR